jgi:uncharacterized UBP type Zn finger protein
MPQTIPQVHSGRLFAGSVEILKQMSTGASSTPLDPAKLRELIAKASPMFGGNQQQDAHEFLLEYVNQLHDELLGKRKEWLDAQSLLDEEDRGTLSTQLYLDSAVQKTFECVACSYTRDKVEPFRDFSLDFPSSLRQSGSKVGSADEKCDLSTMLRNYFLRETLELKCENESCKAVAAHLSKRITQEPRVLVLHLKRFVPNVQKQIYEKQHQCVDFPTRLDLTACLKEAYSGSSNTRLPARPLAAEVSAHGTGRWEVELSEGWKPFSAEEAKKLEDTWIVWPAGECEIEARGQKYTVNFEKKEQFNQASQKTRRVRRRTLPESSTGEVSTGPAYDLRSIVAHDGASPHSGHYVCYAKSENGVWRLYDDSRIQELPNGIDKELSISLGRKAYILFYVLQHA